MFILLSTWLFAAGGRRRGCRAGWLLAIAALLFAALPPTARAQCPAGCTLSSGDVSGTLPTLYIQSTGTAHGTGAFNFGSSSQFLPRTATTGSLPSSCTIGEYLNFGTASSTSPYLCNNATSQWVQFPLFDTLGDLSIPGYAMVGATSSTGEVTFYSAGGYNESLAVAASGSPTGTITIPFGTANMLTDSLQATVTNKILQDSSAAGGVVFGNAADTTRQLAVDLSSAATGTTATIDFRQPSNITVSAPTASSALSGTVYASNSGSDTVSSASGSHAAAFSQRYSLPAGLLTLNKAIRVTAGFSLTTSASPPALALVLQYATSNLSANAFVAPAGSLSGAQATASWIILGTASPGTSVSVLSQPVAVYIPGVTAANSANTVLQPVTGVDTMSSGNVLDIAASWAAGAGSSVTLQQTVVEVLN